MKWSPMSLVEWLLAAVREAPEPDADVVHGARPEQATAHPPIVIDEEGWASGWNVERIPSKRHHGLSSRDEHGPAPVMVVSHWTATGPDTMRGCAKRIRELPGPDDRFVSWHVGIERGGAILQSIPFRRGAAHAGGQSAARFAKDKAGRWIPNPAGRIGANRLSVGIEFEVVGEVRQVGGKWMGWPFGVIDKATGKAKKGPIVPIEDVVEYRGKYFHTFTVEQEVAFLRLLTALAREYPIDRRGASWGHIDIDPTRKGDPGPVWAKLQRPRILDQVYSPLALVQPVEG